MITVIYKCDKCGAEQPTKEQFWEIGVTAKSVDSQSTGNTSFTSGKMMQVCRPCLESLGILVRTREG